MSVNPNGSGQLDVVVVGLGVMGTAAAAELASRGARVLGLDRARPPHSMGSSHGESRMIRQAYYEDPAYVPLVQRAWRLWEAMGERAGATLLHRTGGLMLGPEGGDLLRGVRSSADAHGLLVDELTASEVERRFHPFDVPEGHAGILEERAGYLGTEACVDALLDTARRSGAELHFDEPVAGWDLGDDGVEVATTAGRYRASRLVLAAGPWLPELLPDLPLSLEIERQVQLWFDPRMSGEAAGFHPTRLPVFLWEHAPGHFWYGFPEVTEGVKVAQHHDGEICTPESVHRELTADDVEEMRILLRRHLPKADGKLLHGAVCLYTNTPDGHFLLDVHPDSDRMVIMSPCSGHGFKFAPVMGKIAADLALEGGSELRPDAFSLNARGRVG